MNSEWMKARQTRYGAYLFTYLLVIIAILGATNWLANRHNKSFDSTSNKRFSLSEQTAKVVKGLKNDVNITYFDKTTEFGRARDLLERYNNFSTKLHVTYVDPDKKPQLAKGDQNVAIPTLVRRLPTPVKKIVGNLSKTERALVGLDIQRGR